MHPKVVLIHCGFFLIATDGRESTQHMLTIFLCLLVKTSLKIHDEKTVKAEALNDPQKCEKTTYRPPATCFLYYIIIMGSTFTTTFVNVKFWDKINLAEISVA